MIIVYQQNKYQDKKQALNEFAFCRFPLTVNIDGVDMTFDDFTSLESYIKSL